ncbi:hypothetical protein B0H10DRAFT_1827463, partial [Mycena sp. CBHHK59/15]
SDMLVHSIVHSNDTQFVVNMHAFHNARLLRKVIPVALTKPSLLPLRWVWTDAIRQVSTSLANFGPWIKVGCRALRRPSDGDGRHKNGRQTQF